MLVHVKAVLFPFADYSSSVALTLPLICLQQTILGGSLHFPLCNKMLMKSFFYVDLHKAAVTISKYGQMLADFLYFYSLLNIIFFMCSVLNFLIPSFFTHKLTCRQIYFD